MTCTTTNRINSQPSMIVGGNNSPPITPAVADIGAIAFPPLRNAANLPALRAHILNVASETELAEFLIANNAYPPANQIVWKRDKFSQSLTEILKYAALALIDGEQRRRERLITVTARVMAVNVISTRDGGVFYKLVLASHEFPEAVCSQLPRDLIAGQKVTITGDVKNYRGMSQLNFDDGGLEIIDTIPISCRGLWERWVASAPGVGEPRFVIDANISAITCQKAEAGWKSFRISVAGEQARFGSAAGYVGFPLSEGQRIRLWGTPGVYNGKPQLVIRHAEPLAFEYDNGELRAFIGAGGTKNHFNRLFEIYGADFPRSTRRIPTFSRRCFLARARRRVPRF